MAIKQVSHMITRCMACDSPDGVAGMQCRIIKYIASRADEDVFQRDIEKKFEIRRSSVSGVLSLMEQNGLIIRESVKGDARLKRIVLTERARRLDSEIKEHIERLEDRMKQNLTPDEVKMFFGIMNKIAAGLGDAED